MSSIHQKLDGLLEDLETLIRSGRLDAIAKKVAGLPYSQMSRKHRLAFAKMCRRAGLVHQGLRLLQPVVRGDRNHKGDGTGPEICEYAVLLSRNGSVKESLSLLNSIDPKETAEVYLYRAFCHIMSWDYDLAIPDLEAYLGSDISDYSKMIARVNLAAALIATNELSRANSILTETQSVATQVGANRILANTFELLGHLSILRNELELAGKYLDESSKNFGESATHDQLLVLKWRAILASYKVGSIEPIQKFRTMALERQQWESVRESDFFRLKIDFQESLYNYLMIGSPLMGYRKKLAAEFSGAVPEVTTYGDSNEGWMNLSTGKCSQHPDMKPGKKVHQVINSIVHDFYKPQTTGSLFEILYPDEYFDIRSSPGRVRQALRRTRKWLVENKIPFSIEFESSVYRIQFAKPFGLIVAFRKNRLESHSAHLDLLKQEFQGGGLFSVIDACKLLDISRSSFSRFSNWAINQGSLRVVGKSSSTKYAFADSLKLSEETQSRQKAA